MNGISSATQSGSSPKIVSTRRTPTPPRRPNGTFLSNRNPRQQPGSRRNRPFGPLAPPEDEPTRLAAVLGHRNALLEAGRVLLRALVDMSALIDTGHDARLRDLLLEEVRVFERLCVRANIRVDHRIGARYCLCTALDEAAMRELAARGDASGSAAWASGALTQRIGEDNQGGSKVYALTLRLLDDAADHWPLLELIYRIFSLGFEGPYPHGRTFSAHDRVRERIYNAIAAHLPTVPNALSPHAATIESARPRACFEMPVWLSAALLSAALCALYVYCRIQSGAQADDVQRQLSNIAHTAPYSAIDPPQRDPAR
ncbi:type IVB secretion system protein IcmH/DotU [Burkholderia multivorans]|uniref:Type VI secretion system protein ImpK n=1 Tax=Burkholderia multivorans TaxID=87883 RepID=A0A2S9MDP0_9BURK|nr:type IVB secretion system protein IcmH/DotU [Burkholderia multivorans]MBR7894794.1 type IVB secretion system protein IcmH/DotU [Burkholderia multivorans]MBU9511377.1 type IVB secretion system protein IcmH/DotU [Burkholderia multivorans]MBU9523120.1 type IVB secretion system protein IcmH/DotU [Burkholderia multivorans]MBU9536338.1 type IVB secretion system protein IcmH/DotU [Burkholderia multivorans]MBU9634794.1 type IVB secretion system protein IcmH/DotU [Burkholderia multivorans]